MHGAFSHNWLKGAEESLRPGTERNKLALVGERSVPTGLSLINPRWGGGLFYWSSTPPTSRTSTATGFRLRLLNVSSFTWL